jgi:hypothetical protein
MIGVDVDTGEVDLGGAVFDDRGAGLTGPSDGGGFDDVREFLRTITSRSATRRVNTTICAA